ncbi:MAG TPA: MarR family transcriptional regulator [Pseudonocardia sp.]|uniref:MarR family winged helix-turn-helix transcriptional regulator n=1 Tax=Pseudonocardia sp. TaxID=60912 RepID=UPI002F3EC0A4
MPGEPDRLAEQIGEFRRAMLPGLFGQLSRGFGGLDLSIMQVAALYELDGDTSPTVRMLADRIGRSVSATSRLVEQLVVAGLVDRTEDRTDRRSKRLGLTERGRAMLRSFEHTRASAQLEVTRYLSTDEQRRVADGMALLAEGARRHRNDARTAQTH